MRMVDDAATSRGSGCRGCRLSHLSSCRSDFVSAGISQEPLCPLPCLAKHFALGRLFRFDCRRALAFERCCRYGFSPVRNSGFAGHVVLVDCSVVQSMAGRALRIASVRRSGCAPALAVSWMRTKWVPGPRCQISGKIKSHYFIVTGFRRPATSDFQARLDILVRIVQNNQFAWHHTLHHRRPR